MQFLIFQESTQECKYGQIDQQQLKLVKQQESANRVRDVKNILAYRMAKPVATQPETPKTTFITITSATQLGEELQKSKEILLYSYFSSNIEVSEFADGKITYFDRKGDGDFIHKLTTWLMDKTGHAWEMVHANKDVHVHTISEQKQEELVADPLVASAMSLFENAEIVGVK